MKNVVLGRRFLRLALPMTAYAVLLLGAMWFLKAWPGSAWKIPVALAPVVPIAFVVLRGVPPDEEMDELERKIALEGSRFAQRGAVLTAIAYGFLQGVGFPAVNAMYLGVLIIALSMLGRRLAQWKYR
jgi:hypothetical protein